jgi:hypothetical protein
VTAVNGNPPGNGPAAVVLGNGGPVTIAGFAQADPSKTFHDVSIRNVIAASDRVSPVGALQAAWRIGYGPGAPGRTLVSALGAGLGGIPGDIRTLFANLKDVISLPGSGGITGSLQGPVGIYQQTSIASKSGWITLVEIAAVISLNLGVMNLLPIPFLDGGRFLFIMIEAVRRRRVDPKIEAMVHAAGLAVILSFAVYITIFGDIGRLFNAS